MEILDGWGNLAGAEFLPLRAFLAFFCKISTPVMKRSMILFQLFCWNVCKCLFYCQRSDTPSFCKCSDLEIDLLRPENQQFLQDSMHDILQRLGKILWKCLQKLYSLKSFRYKCCIQKLYLPEEASIVDDPSDFNDPVTPFVVTSNFSD